MSLESERTLPGKEGFEGGGSDLWVVVHWQQVKPHMLLLNAEREERAPCRCLDPPVSRLIGHTV